MAHKSVMNEIRTMEQLRQDYEIEKELANRLRHASREERRLLYSSVYDELFKRTAHHPQLIKKSSPDMISARVRSQMKFIGRFLDKDATFLEVGPGDCSLSIEVAGCVKQVFAIDVSAAITKKLKFPNNFNLLISNGSDIPLPESSINIAYSNQLMEHLHPDDAKEQLENMALS